MTRLDVASRAARNAPEVSLQPLSYAVTLVGAGALGAEIGLAFTQCLPGVIQSVTVVDPDLVQPHNIHASKAWALIASNLGGQVIGNSKADYVVQYCKALAPHTQWLSKTCEFADVGWGELLESDVIITCTDAVVSRMEAAYAARTLRKPMLDAGVLGPGMIGGRLAFYAPHADAACYACGLSVTTRAAVLEHMASPSLSCAAMSDGTAMGTSQEGAASAVMVAMQLANQFRESLPAATSTAWRVLDERIEPAALSLSADCPWHHDAECVALEEDRPVHTVMSANDVLLLPWPMTLTATCAHCRARHETPIRLARLRQGLRCTLCGNASLQPERVVERILKHDDLAQRTPAELGLPPQSVLPVRRRIQTQRTD